MFKVVAVVFIKLNVEAVVNKSAPFTLTSPDVVMLPVDCKVPEVFKLPDESICKAEAAPTDKSVAGAVTPTPTLELEAST